MPSTYQQAGDEVREMAKSLVLQYHNELAEFDVKIDYVFAFGEIDEETNEKLAPAIKHNGWPAAGLASRTKLKDRVKGMGDCEILLDGDEWPKMTYAQQLALLDHELEHFEIKRDKFGNVEKDDIDRPKITMREHDRQHGWFDNIARRHGINSMEVSQFRKIITEAGADYVPHARLADPTDEPISTELQDTVTEIVSGNLIEKHFPGEDVTVTATVGKRILKPKTEPEKFKVTLSSNGGPEVDVTKSFEHLRKEGNPDGPDKDVESAAIIVIDEQIASTSLIQRRLKIGYTRASKIMAELEARSIVGPMKADASGYQSREVLVKKGENQ